MFADVAVNTKSSRRDDLFTYSVPKDTEGIVCVGQLVLIPLGNRTVNGIVIKLHNKKPKFPTKEIKKIVDPSSLVGEHQVKLAQFISDYYWCGFSQTLFAMLPPNLRHRRRKLQITNHKPQTNSKVQISKYKLTDGQEKVLEKIRGSVKKDKFKSYLLHGVTNSGKTEIYLRTFDEVLKSGPANNSSNNQAGKGSGIFIVPEISLTPQTIERFEKVFGHERIAVVHSKLSISERLQTWLDIKEGKKDIVIGSRSAIFAPLPRLKLIIVDEEHDLISFKSDQTPRYELHNVAEELARLTGSVLILGTATPLVESYNKVLEGKWEYLSLPERIDSKSFPKIKIVDMNEQILGKNFSLFSSHLSEALKIVLNNKRQALLFLNRRGMATVLLCRDCGKILHCESCEVPLVYHLSNNKLWCHHCGKTYDLIGKCFSCGGFNIQFLGRGTERIEEEIKKIFPKARVDRMDHDTMLSQENYQRVFGEFAQGKTDVLVGTQMIVHGWDIPSVDLAGIIGLDAALNVPDFRSGEKVFQLITQLAGRTGRKDSQGLLILQTFDPENWLFETAAKGDYVSFVKRELAMREKFGYPPFAKIIKLSLSGKDKMLVEKKATELKQKLETIIHNTDYQLQILGPAYPLVPRKYGRYWQNIIVKFPISNFQFPIKESLRDDLLNTVPKEWTIDIDPLTLL